MRVNLQINSPMKSCAAVEDQEHFEPQMVNNSVRRRVAIDEFPPSPSERWKNGINKIETTSRGIVSSGVMRTTVGITGAGQSVVSHAFHRDRAGEYFIWRIVRKYFALAHFPAPSRRKKHRSPSRNDRIYLSPFTLRAPTYHFR